MVQRKVPNKLGIKPDNFKPGSLKPASQHQDCKTRTSELAKKMKKSRSIKLSDMASPRSSVFKRNVFLPGKPPPADVTTITATPKKQKPSNKTLEGSPNYMKSTSSSAARKESLQSPVSSRGNTRAESDTKILCRRDLSSWKNSPASAKKLARSLTKSSSLKLVRTLTKTPSFKNARATIKKCSRVALCAEVNAQKATCSSTLKDSKFPPYLDLDPGGTESEGTSVMKVCPYTYCSLNGHRHASLPPLKRFLSARRRMMKSQRNLRLEALIPRKGKQGAAENKNIDEKLGSQEPDLSNSGASDMMQEVGVDYFIEIYANDKIDNSKATEEIKGNHSFGTAQECLSDLPPPYGGGDDGKQVTESLSDGSPHSEIDFEEDFGGVDSAESFADVNNHFPCNFGHGMNSEIEYQADDVSSKASDMDWEEGKLFSPENDCLIKLDDESDSKDGHLFAIKDRYSQDESELKAKENITTLHEEVLADEKPEEISVKEYSYLQVWFDYDQISIEGMTVGDDVEGKTLFPDKKNSELGSETSKISDFPDTGKDSTDEDNGNQRVEESDRDQLISSAGFGLEGATRPSRECNDEAEEQLSEAELLANFQTSDEVSCTADDDDDLEVTEPGQTDDASKSSNLAQASVEENHRSATVDNHKEKDPGELEEFKFFCAINPEEQSDLGTNKSRSTDELMAEINGMEGQNDMNMDSNELFHVKGNATDRNPGNNTSYRSETKSTNEDSDELNNRRWTFQSKRPVEDLDELRQFNPREPNYLPVVPEPEGEKVDLRHQEMDERKSSEEWMLDHALQKAVNKLAPARKRKVALLVEAYETVMPVTNCETRVKHAPPAFLHGRTIQACS